MRRLERNRILVGDARRVLRQLPSASIDTVITSPPYFRLRNYGHEDQIGLEQHVDQWVDELRLVARGLARVLKPSGSVWLNLGDTFSRHEHEGAPPKSLLLAPERLALALIADGWILRTKAVWAKPNPMPTSVRDRLSSTWEIVYFLVRSRHYYFDLDAIRVPHRGSAAGTRSSRGSAWSVPKEWRGPSAGSNSGLDRLKAAGLPGHPLGKNPGDVWTIATAGYRGAHHAVFPERLVERPLRATCPTWTCRRCGKPWIGDVPGCSCRADRRPGVMLDPFFGSGTTGIVAERLGRDWIGIEVNPKLVALAEDRLASARTLTTEEPTQQAA